MFRKSSLSRKNSEKPEAEQSILNMAVDAINALETKAAAIANPPEMEQSVVSELRKSILKSNEQKRTIEKLHSKNSKLARSLEEARDQIWRAFFEREHIC